MKIYPTRLMCRGLINAIVTIMVAACSSTTINRTANTSSSPLSLSILFTSARLLELEPCGCGMNPIGGLEREWELHSRLQKDNSHREKLYLSAGTAFRSKAIDDNGLSPAYRLKKAEFLIKGLNKLGLKALSPGTFDYTLPLDELKRLQSQSDFKWISSNVFYEGKTAFEPFWKWRKGSREILILGVAPPSFSALAPGFEIREPSEVVSRIIEKEAGKNTLVVLLSSLPDSSREELINKVPGIHIVLGGKLNEETEGIVQPSATLLRANPANEGKEVAELNLEWGNSSLSFYSAETARVFALRREEIQKQLKSRKLPTYESLRLQKRLQEVQSVLTVNAEDAITYQGKIWRLGKGFDTVSNPMNEILKHYKEAVREISMSSDEE